MKELDFQRDFIIADGAMGTKLVELGVDLKKTSSEMLNFESKELIEGIHKEYIDAGAEIILSNTFMCNILNAKKSGYSLKEVITTALEIGKKASGDKISLALDIGPLSYYLDENSDDFENIVEENTERIIKAGNDNFDLILFETLGSIKEGEIVLNKAKTLTEKPIICSFTLSGKKDVEGFLDELCNTFNESGIRALGINCTEYKVILEALDILKVKTKLPIMVKANLGIPKKVEGELMYFQSPLEFEEFSKKAKELGAKIIGGCCGTTPEYIRELKGLL